MATATCKLMYNITIHMTGYGVRILLTEKTASLQRLERRTREKTAEKDCRDRTCGFDNHLVTSCVSCAQNCGKMQISHFADRPFRHFMRVGRSKLRSKLW